MFTPYLMRFYPIMLLLAGAVVSSAARAEAPVDCPLRDAPFSLDSPLMDIMLNEHASAMTNRHLDGAIDKLPPIFASAEAPSFSAILNLRLLAGMGGLDAALLEPLGAELATLPVTDADRTARCRRYDNRSPELRIPEGHPRVLVFEKMTGYRDGPSVEAAAAAMQQLASRHGWALVSTDAGGAITPQVLAQFDVVVWNNVSGDVLTLSQRQAFEDYINNGGGYVGMHGSAGDPLYFWDWYVDTLIGARFTGHPMDPQFQDARINLETNPAHIGDGLGDGWTMNDEWYSFKSSARASGSTVIATLDESTYSQNGRWGQNVSMGNDHPIVWTRDVGKGRAFYSAIGHRPETYSDERHLKLLEQGIEWAAGNH